MKNKFSIAMSLAVIVAMLVTSLALADNVQDDVTGSGPVAFAAGDSTTIKYWIQDTNSDGCGASDATPVTIIINAPAGVAATPSSLLFTACGSSSSNTKSVVYTSSLAGSYDVTVTASDADSNDDYNTNPAKVTLNVSAPPPPTDTTAPSITPNVAGTLGNNGWYTSNVTVSWSVVDNESAISSSSGCGSTTINSDTTGTTLTCTATSVGGTASNSITIKRDATAPTISSSASPAANTNGWNNTDVTVSYSCTDNGPSGVDTTASDLTDDLLTASGTASGTCVDLAGNLANASYAAQIDKVKPVITGSRTPTPNINGWNNTDVVVSFSCTDSGGSGIDTDTVAGATISNEGAGQSVTNTGSCSDKAGNFADPATVSGINIDKTAPAVSLVGGPANGGSYYFGSVPAAPTCSASDTLSGLDGNCSISGYSAAVGSHTVTASATDKAGNSNITSVSYSVLAWTLNGFYQPVDMGIMNNAKAGSTVPLKFEVFAGSTELTSTSIVQTFTQKISCAAGVGDDIEAYATGNTTLRYDTTGGQFIFNWQTPKAAGSCYRVTLTTQDGTTIYAEFRLK